MMINYEDINFKCGIEIHQQIDSKKLFCNCPSEISTDNFEKPDIIVKRRLRPVAGETGEIDIAALHEFWKNKYIIYKGYYANTCYVELDEEPPHDINKEALEVGLKFALITNAKIFRAIQVMRKTVVDGSNTSGFQRTCLIAVDGKISTSLGDVGIQSICIEEDAARKISEDENSITYGLDRLGIPLIEIATSPDIKSPEHAREVAEKIGTILRTLKVKRGIGTIRQDINVSIKDGARVEIKGCQELNLIPKILDYEVKRQLTLIELKNLNLCKEEDVNNTKVVDLGEIFKLTKCKIIANSLNNNGVVYGIKLKNFSKHIGSKFCGIENIPRFGKEIAGYLKAKTKLKGLFHSDELPNYGISEEEVKKISEILDCKENDAYVIVTGEKDEVMKGLNVIIERVKIALNRVPEEVRRATENGETEYMRPLPGAARMYPETDIPIIYIDDKYLENLKNSLPEDIDAKFKRYENLVGKELANQLIHSKYSEFFDKYLKFKIKPSLIATLLLSISKEIKKKYNYDFNVFENLNLIEEIFELIEKGVISHSSVSEILYYAKKENKNIKDVIEERNLKIASREEVLKKIKEILSKDEKLKENKGKLIGVIMKEFKGKANIEYVKEIIENEKF